MKTSSQTTVAITTSDSACIPPSEKRRALIISAPATNRFTLSQAGVAVLDVGLTIYPATRPVILCYAEVGEAVNHAWRAISAVANQNVTYIEIFD